MAAEQTVGTREPADILRCVCGATEGQRLFVAGGNDVVRCSACGQVRVNITQPYSYSFDYFENQHSYYQRRDEFLKVFDGLFAFVERFQAPGRLLDVGTGSGLLMVAAERRGWSATGVEFSPEAAMFARDELGLDVSAGDVLASPPGPYDSVVFNHVLEHVRDPVRDLRHAKTLLRPGGVLVIGVPNFGSWMARLRREKWASLHPDEHYWQFTRASLTRLGSSLGLQPVGFDTGNYVIEKVRGLKDVIYRLQSPITVALGKGEAMTCLFRAPLD
jgi:2-polyprenyl-3-methyl-5-hydroxy-6-metoxy-1,4-benzoquinol methylase